jgi:hypothetical protein
MQLLNHDFDLTNSQAATLQHIGFLDLMPLLSLTSITSFHIEHDFPLSITDNNISQIAQSWPHLKKIDLNCQPTVCFHAPLDTTLWALLPFAQHCPELTHLGLYVDARKKPLPITVPHNFAHGLHLSLGASHIDNASVVGPFLYMMCPNDLHIKFDIYWILQTKASIQDNFFLLEDIIEQLGNFHVTWSQVEVVYAVLQKINYQ